MDDAKRRSKETGLLELALFAIALPTPVRIVLGESLELRIFDNAVKAISPCFRNSDSMNTKAAYADVTANQGIYAVQYRLECEARTVKDRD